VNSFQAMVREFHLLSGQAAPERVEFTGLPVAMRVKLIREESEEVVAALLTREMFGGEENEAHLLSELVDLLYVTFGTAVSAGVDLAPFFEAVHVANMAKVDGSLGPVVIRPDGKILKPTGWKKADLLPLLLKAKAGGR
jgi:predicted HAD superfamily Cof-like phosphohydrolase